MKKTKVVFKSLSDDTKIPCIAIAIIEKVKEEIPQIPVIMFKSFIGAGCSFLQNVKYKGTLVVQKNPQRSGKNQCTETFRNENELTLINVLLSV